MTAEAGGRGGCSSMNGRRCFGDGAGREFYARYHDEEWGLPVHDDRRLLEYLVLEGAQAGLSWELILKRREAYRRAFHDFYPAKVAAMTEAELEALMSDSGVIRNRLKVWSARDNARLFLEIAGKVGSFDHYVWGFVEGNPIQNWWERREDVPCVSTTGDALARDLKARGMRFVGPKIIYSFMQAVGMVNDHLVSCPRHADLI